jgi:transcriptional regulator with XRE-family HTH domain
VIDMALLSVIRRWHFREHLSIREICRRTGLSRNTIRKYLRSDAVEPAFKVPERPSKLDPFADRLSAWLKTEANKPRKQKRTILQLHADLVSLGYGGSYNRVAAFAREWKADRQREMNTTGRGTFVPLTFEPGEAFQFDWSEDWAIIGNERTKLQVAHTKLSYSRAFIVRAYLLQTHEVHRPDLVRFRRLGAVVAQLGFHSALRHLVPELQAHLFVKPIDSFGVHIPALASQQHMHPAVAVAHARLADLFDPQLQSGLLAALALVVVERPVDPQRIACLADRYLPGLPHLIDEGSLASRPQS